MSCRRIAKFKFYILLQICDSYSNLPHSYSASGDQNTSTSLMGEYNFLVEEYEVLVPIIQN